MSVSKKLEGERKKERLNLCQGRKKKDEWTETESKTVVTLLPFLSCVGVKLKGLSVQLANFMNNIRPMI